MREIVSALNAVVGFAHMLAEDETRVPRDQRVRYADHVREAARALLSLVPAALGVETGASAQRDSGAHSIAPPAPASSVPPPPPEGGMSMNPIAPEPEGRARVLVVDADASARELVAAYLEGRGVDLCLVGSGAEALACTGALAPDLVLIEAADDDAFSVARELKERDAYLPVVFFVPIGDGGARVRALDAGAEQFLEKPLGRHELRARVRNLLNLRRNQRALAAQNEQLRSLQAFKDEMAALMVHDLKSPLSAISMNVDVALGGLPEHESTEEVRAALEDCRVAAARLFRMIANLLDIARSEDGRLVVRAGPVDLAQLVQKIAADHATEATLRRVHLACSTDVRGEFELDADLLGRVIENLIENGMRYTRPGGRLAVAARDTGDALEVRVSNDGPPIPEEARAHIFEKYGQVSGGGTTRVNRGLGLYFCRVAAEAHGGTIALDEEPGMTTCFRVTLARRPA